MKNEGPKYTCAVCGAEVHNTAHCPTCGRPLVLVALPPPPECDACFTSPCRCLEILNGR